MSAVVLALPDKQSQLLLELAQNAAPAKNTRLCLPLMTVPMPVQPSGEVVFALDKPLEAKVIGNGFYSVNDTSTYVTALKVDPKACKQFCQTLKQQLGQDLECEHTRKYDIPMFQEVLGPGALDDLRLVQSLRKLYANKVVLRFDRLVYAPLQTGK